jgi:Flp pilus assembly protein TadD
LTWPPYDPRDNRPFLAPDVYTPLTSADYRSNIDPALRAIVERGSMPSLSARIESALSRGDTAGAAKLLAAASADVANRFRSPEAELNDLGYRLLNAQQLSAAIAVFRINANGFPRSANVWDSLGEALLIGGRRDEAIVSYRRALEVDPEFRSSREALDRLGVR